MPRLVFYILTWKSLINRAQYNIWRCCSRLKRRLLLVLNTVPQPSQEEASICHLVTTRPPLRRSPLTAHWLQQSANQSPRPLTHSMIICALEKSVPFVLGYSGLGKKRVKEHDVTTCGRQVKVYLQFYRTAPSDSGSLFKAVYSSGVIQRTLQCKREEATSSSVDKTMMSALTECYCAADSWEMRRQILSCSIIDEIEISLNSIIFIVFLFVQLALFTAKYLSVSWLYCPALKGWLLERTNSIGVPIGPYGTYDNKMLERICRTNRK